MVSVEQLAWRLEKYEICLVSGEQGKERGIDYINIQELPLISERVHPRGFILTTFAAFQGEQGIVSHVEWLISRKISALGIHAAGWAVVPESLLELSNKHGLPIFTIPIDLSYKEIFKEFNELLLDENDALRVRIEEMNLQLLESVAQDKGVSYIVATLGKYLASPIVFLDQSLNIVSIWTNNTYNREEYSLTVKAVLEQEKERLYKEKYIEVGKVLTESFSTQYDLTFSVIPIMEHTENHGFLIIGSSGAEELMINSAIQFGRTALLLDAVKRKSLERFLKNQEIRTLEVLIENKTDQSSHSSSLSSSLRKMSHMYVFHFDNEDLINYGFAVIYDKLEGRDSDKIIWIYEQEVICLTSIPFEADRLQEVMSSLQGATCGVSDSRPSKIEKDITQKYKEARRCIELESQLKRNVIFFQELGVERFLFMMREEDFIQDAARDLLKPILHFDAYNQAELTRTLDVYLKNFFSLKKSAEDLYVHRNTVSYRIEKIKDLYPDVNFENHDHYLLFSIALKLIS